jgi:hypothetical protein
MLTIVSILAIALFLFNVLQYAELHSQDKLLNACADKLVDIDLENKQLLVKNTSVLNAVTNLRWVLTSIRDCNNGDPVFEIWAKQLAKDSLERSKKAYDN